MRAIIGVLVGNIADMVISTVSGAAVVLILVIVGMAGVRPGEAQLSQAEIATTLAASPAIIMCSFVTGALSSVAAGYIAAWIARRAELLCGLASALFCVSIGVHGLILGSSVLPKAAVLGSILLSPLLGLLGGWIRRVTARNRAFS
jgi:hypothetical protein